MSMQPHPPFPIPVTLGSPTEEGKSEDPSPALAPVPGVGEIVLIASGKGGVGKSTVAVNLACGLKRLGRRVGVLDADLYGPSVARMLGTGVGCATDGFGRALPNERHGIASISVANVLPPEAALVWKGPLVSQGVLQMFREVAWPELDVLLVDLPPGTGDVALTILEQVPVTGAVIVTTPQQLAVIDAERGIAMFHQRDIPVLGLVENMATYICPCCGEEQPLFPQGGVRMLAERRHVRHLSRIPLAPGAQDLADSGTPLVEFATESTAADAFMTIAEAVDDAIRLARRARERENDDAERGRHRAFWERLLEDE